VTTQPLPSDAQPQQSNRVSWLFAAYITVFLVLILVSGATRATVQPVTKTDSDYVISFGIALAVFLALYVPSLGKLSAARGRRLGTAFGIAYMIAFFGRSAFFVFNAGLDHGVSRNYAAVIERVGCVKGGGTWWLVGAPSLPTASNRMSIVGADCGRFEGDTVIVEVRPGFLGRPWVAGYTRH